MQLTSILVCLVIICIAAGTDIVQSSSQESCDFKGLLPKQEVPRTRL
jgi:hypothetical protein